MVVADVAIKVALEGTAGMILSAIIVMAAINGVRGSFANQRYDRGAG